MDVRIILANRIDLIRPSYKKLRLDEWDQIAFLSLLLIALTFSRRPSKFWG